jgi:hypothetical protein
MYRRVRFDFSVTGDLDDLDVYANREHIKVVNGKGRFAGQYSTGILTVTFMLSGPNGTDYKIEYECAVEGQKAEDPRNASPIEGRIRKNGYKEEVVRINL